MVENERCKILWEMTIKYDHGVKTNIVVVEKECNKAIIIVDVGSPWDPRG